MEFIITSKKTIEAFLWVNAIPKIPLCITYDYFEFNIILFNWESKQLK